jgi:hypothetical protein
MFPFRPHLEPSTAHIGNTGADALPNATRHGTGTIAPVSVLSPAQRGFSTGPAQARPSTSTGTAGTSQQHTQASTYRNVSPNRSDNIAGTASTHGLWSDVTPTSIPPDLQQIQSKLGLNNPQDWQDFRYFVEAQVNASDAAWQHDASQATSTSQELDDIRHAAGLYSPEDWAALQQYVSDRLHSSSNAQTGASIAATSRANDSSNAQPVASTPLTHPWPALFRKILEATATQPSDSVDSIPLSNKGLFPLPDHTNVTYGDTSAPNGPNRRQLQGYVTLFLKQYGYRVENVSAHANSGVLRATNPDSGDTFYVHVRTSASPYTRRPLSWDPRNGLTPQHTPHILAVVNHNPVTPSKMGQIYLVHI